MSVNIKDVLALLIKKYPGIQMVPMKNIRPNPDNPGPPATDEQIRELSDDIDRRGLLNHIKLWPDPADPLVEGVTLHPDDPNLRGDGIPWTLADFYWSILGGNRRFRACDRLKWTEIPATILNPTPGEAVEINQLDNDVLAKGWWASYQNIENRIKADPNLSQRQVAVRLNLYVKKVNRAVRIIPLLNKEARALLTVMPAHPTD